MRIALWHFLMKDAAAGRHPLHVARAQAPAIPETVAMLDSPREYIGDRLDAAMGVPRKPGQIFVGVVVAKVVEQQERVVFGCVAEPERAAQLHPGALECGFGLGNALDGSDGHVMAPFRCGILRVYAQGPTSRRTLRSDPGLRCATEHCLEY